MEKALPSLFSEFKNHLAQGLRDDGSEMDWTTLGTVAKNNKSVRAKIVAKAPGVFFGEELARAAEILSVDLGSSLKIKSLKKDGDLLKKGEIAWEWSGSARSILVIERPFLNLASYLGGIATRTRTLVDHVEKEAKKKKIQAPRVTSTRKTLPYYRDLAVCAVIAGGGYAHRVSLSGGVLIKENHIRAAGGIKKAILGVRSGAPHLLKTEIEVTNFEELGVALAENADVIMLDNFTPAQVKKATAFIAKSGKTPSLEISGGVHEGNIRDYVLPGVHLISVGGLTHSVKALDLSLLFE